MFEKVVYKIMLGACCAGVVTGVGGAIYALVNTIKEERKIDKTFDELEERNRRRYEMIEELLAKKIQEAE